MGDVLSPTKNTLSFRHKPFSLIDFFAPGTEPEFPGLKNTLVFRQKLFFLLDLVARQPFRVGWKMGKSKKFPRYNHTARLLQAHSRSIMRSFFFIILLNYNFL